MINDSPDDLGGYGLEDDDGAYSPTHANMNDTVKSSAHCMGDHDEHPPLKKLTSLIEDISKPKTHSH